MSTAAIALPITREQLIEVGRLVYGDDWVMPLAEEAGWNERTVRRWAKGSQPIPDIRAKIRAVIAAEIERDQAFIKECDRHIAALAAVLGEWS